MALLIAGLAVMAVIDADDREIGRVHHRDRRERADIHQQLAVTGHDEHALVGTGEREAEPDLHAPTHRPGHRIGVRPVAGQSCDIAARAGEPADDQKILVPADQRRHRVAPVEDEIQGDPPRFVALARSLGDIWPSSELLGAEQLLGQQHRDGITALKHHRQRGADGRTTSSGCSIRKQMTPIASSTGSTA